jgi:hypothetical protein
MCWESSLLLYFCKPVVDTNLPSGIEADELRCKSSPLIIMLCAYIWSNCQGDIGQYVTQFL